MKKSYYLFNPGRLSRKDNTPLKVQLNKYIPIETVDNLYAFGRLDSNSALYNFLGKEQISVHFFDYYEYYTASFMPKDYLLSGKMVIPQAETYQNLAKRTMLAKK
jgi:CRISPR-associated protein Cas1